MITLNHCNNCETNFMIPIEWSNGLDTTMFVCPECSSKNWMKLSDSPIIKEKQPVDELIF